MLHGVRVMVTRAAGRNGGLRAALEAQGATVMGVPCIAVEAAPDAGALREALTSLGPEDWLLVTSPNGARAVMPYLAEPYPQVGAVGPGTAAVLRAAGVPVDRVAERPDGLGLAETLAAEVAGRTVLLARGDRASDDLPRALRASGATVREVCAYRTVADPDLDRCLQAALADGPPDWVALASGSAFEHLHAAWPGVLRCRLAVIGPRTREAVERAGGKVEAEALSPDPEAFARSIARAASGAPSP